MVKRYLRQAILFLAAVPVWGCISYSGANTKVSHDVVIGQDARAASPSAGVNAVGARGSRTISSDQVLIQYSHYQVLYSSSYRIPLWVEYELTAAHTDGPYARKGKSFRQDEKVNVPQADNEDYRGSGWSRGHMAPAGDFKWDDDAMWDTFFYTNCCPQNMALNNGLWNALEQKVREWARLLGSVRVITGPVVGNNAYGTLGSHKVVIPDAFFKIIYSDTGKQSIAFVMYNRDSNGRMRDCILTVDEVEAMTGIDFLSDLGNRIESQVESTCTPAYWGM